MERDVNLEHIGPERRGGEAREDGAGVVGEPDPYLQFVGFRLAGGRRFVQKVRQ